MKLYQKIWWIALLVLLAPTTYLAYWISQLARGQAARMDSIAFAIAEDPEAWEGITFGGQHPLEVYHALREVNEYMFVAGGLSAAVLTAAIVLLLLGWFLSSRRASAGPST